MDNFKVIYHILAFFEASINVPEPDYRSIQAEALGIAKSRWNELVNMLYHDGYLSAHAVKEEMQTEDLTRIRLVGPYITVKGLEYLSESKMMQRARESSSSQ